MKPVVRLLAGAATVVTVVALAASAGPGAEQGTKRELPTAASAVSVRIDPSYKQQAFEGWGTSLAWFAEATGNYPDPVRKRLADLVFGADGLNLNIARYNIGGGNAPDTKSDYMKTGADVPGFWRAPDGTTRKDVDWWSADDPEDWNWDADPAQRWWVDAIKDRVTHWQAFSNSPPWFQTVSGYVSGGTDPKADQIRPDRVDQFAAYLVRVAQHLEDVHGIKFDSIEPLNEPGTDYWHTDLGADGTPTGVVQEGAHATPATQAALVVALRKALGGADTKVAAMDETNPGLAMLDWAGYSQAARDAVAQLNVHTYGTVARTGLRDVARATGKPVWMSEVDGGFGTGKTDYTGMGPGLGIAAQIVDDLRELEPTAWVLWQAVDDAKTQQPAAQNWGALHIPYDCGADATLESCPIRTNSKFNTIRNFTHYIRPGDHLVKVDDTDTAAAVRAKGDGATVVHVNSSKQTRAVTLDLSGFGTVAGNARVTPVTSDADGALVEGDPVPVTGRTATLVVPGESVTTFVVDGVSGVDQHTALIQAGHVYRLQGVKSALTMTPAAGNAVAVRKDDPGSAEQLWSVRALTNGGTNRERYTIVSATTGRSLADSGGKLVLTDKPKDEAQWMMATTGDGSWTLINVKTGRLVDVPAAEAKDGSPVATGAVTAGAGQRWRLIDETVLSTEPATGYTSPGRVPQLPDRVVAMRPDGARGKLPISWTMPAEATWSEPGLVLVQGMATGPLGKSYPATAVVTVDDFTGTSPAEVRTYPGGTPELPETVTGLGRGGGRADLPVAWQPAAPGAYDQLGTVTLRGTVQLADGHTLDATAQVRVVEPVEVNVVRSEYSWMGATYTEAPTAAADLHNGDLTEKAWSNWRPDKVDPVDTVTIGLARKHDLTKVVVYFYRDGVGPTFPKNVLVQAMDESGTWHDAAKPVAVPDNGSPVVEVPLSGLGPAGLVRVVMYDPRESHMTVSEIEVYAKQAP